jgi:DNA-binding XRE family transcriptional regulator
MTTKRGAATRFVELARSHDSDDCLLWPFSTNVKGYAQVRADGTVRLVHSMICEEFHGPRPEGFVTAHSCNVRHCVNWRHVRWATPQENSDDMIEHGTRRYGEAVTTSKLTEDQVKAIRDAYARSELTQQALADTYGISNQHVSDICSGRRWAHLC